jgi:hypothetical protein
VDKDDNELGLALKLTLGKPQLSTGSDLARYRVRNTAISKVGRYILRCRYSNLKIAVNMLLKVMAPSTLL